jgi:hypothetical protein
LYRREREIMTGKLISAGRGSRAARLVACLPIVLGLGAAAAGFHQTRGARNLAESRIGAMTGRQAEETARRLTATLFGGAPAEVHAVTGLSSGVQPVGEPRWNEWQVSCRTTAGDLLFRINADTGEPVLVRREYTTDADAPDAADANGDIRGGVSHREALLHARRYLRLAGVSVPPGERPVRSRGFDFTFRVAATGGRVRTLCVSLDPRDGGLESLLTMVSRRFGPARSARRASVPAAT